MLKSIKSTIRKMLAEPIRFAKRVYFYGNRFFCPCCGGHFRKMSTYKGSFYIKGELINADADNAVCPVCGSHMRYRFLLTFLKNNTDILKEKTRLLHFAPEKETADFFRKQKNIEYVAADIDPSKYAGAVRADITDNGFPDNSFDAVIASHVLEHIVDDKKAISEIYRVIKPGGWSILVVPLYDEAFEDASLDYEGREKMYGIGLHVRLNSLKDFKEKLSDVGFKVSAYSIDDVAGNYVDRTAKSLYIESDRYLFLCKK